MAKGSKGKGKASSSPLSMKASQVAGLSVNLTVMERFLSEAVSRFKERRYHAASQLAKDSVQKIEQKVKDYVQANWAIAIISANRLLELSDGEDTDATKAVNKHLKKAMDAFKEETYLQAPDLLEALNDAAQDLYFEEIERARDHLTSQNRTLKEIEAMGGEVAQVRTSLRRATEALDDDDLATYREHIEKADELLDRSKERRIEELEEAAESMASKFLKDVRQAIETGDFVSANYLVSSAEQTTATKGTAKGGAGEALDEETLKKVQSFINRIRPLIVEAQDEGFEASDALEELEQAVRLLNSGDHVRALVKAKRAYGAVKAFRSGEEPELPPEEPEETEEAEEAAEEEPGEPQEETDGEEADEEGPEEEAEEEPEEAPPEEEEEPPVEIDAEPVLWCARCGSINIEVASNGQAACLDCGEILPQKAVS